LSREVGRTEEKVTTISKSREMPASLHRLWEIVSDVDNEPKYYDGLNSVKNLSRNGNVIEREVVVGYLKHEGRQTITLNPKTFVEVKMTKGPMIGTRLTSLTPLTDSNTRVDVSWRVEFRVPTFVRGMVRREVEKGTENALNRIAKAAESK
jgi:ribosome-associated toxin RatA of RatAB toxin-antitoxin module